ncbi:NAD-dependent epimerase/dehydratase family protein [Paenibacillus sp. YYML68]|uniref:NAD-dependent epimerase/dehydratase family protein n=1 Tax=Paenibacillus sp. YYML68 TaxID=2909250 RepID=UPI00248F9A2A|nr:NAD(P)H-binding protein [Paenibacillus sp. YYML68]
MGKHAVVVGATGLVGTELVRLLLKESTYERVVVLVRTGMEMSDPRLDQRIISFDQLEQLPQELFREADVFCTLGTTMKKAKTQEQFMKVDYAYPLSLGQLAKRHGAARMLIVTAMGADAGSMFFYNRVKGMVEKELLSLGLNELYIFRPSLIMGPRAEHRAGESLAQSVSERLPFLFAGPLRPYRPIQARTIAEAMTNVALQRVRPSQSVIRSEEVAQLALAGKG